MVAAIGLVVAVGVACLKLLRSGDGMDVTALLVLVIICDVVVVVVMMDDEVASSTVVASELVVVESSLPSITLLLPEPGLLPLEVLAFFLGRYL